MLVADGYESFGDLAEGAPIRGEFQGDGQSAAGTVQFKCYFDTCLAVGFDVDLRDRAALARWTGHAQPKCCIIWEGVAHVGSECDDAVRVTADSIRSERPFDGVNVEVGVLSPKGHHPSMFSLDSFGVEAAADPEVASQQRGSALHDPAIIDEVEPFEESVVGHLSLQLSNCPPTRRRYGLDPISQRRAKRRWCRVAPRPTHPGPQLATSPRRDLR